MDKLLIVAAILFPAVAGLFFYLWRRNEVRPVVPDDSPSPGALGPVITPPGGRKRPEAQAAPQAPLPEHLKGNVHYIARFTQSHAFTVDEAARDGLLGALAPHCLSGQDLIAYSGDGGWDELEPDKPYHGMAWVTALANRSGRLQEGHIAEIEKTIRNFAAGQDLLVETPDAEGARKNAEDLDQFCREVDCVITVILSGGGGSRSAGNTVRSVRDLAQAEGLVEDTEGDVAYYEENQRLFTVRTREGRSLVKEPETRSLAGLRLGMEVTRLTDPAKAFDTMVGIARKLAQPLQFSLTEEQGIPLSGENLADVRESIDAIRAKMDSRGVRPGSLTALTLFS